MYVYINREDIRYFLSIAIAMPIPPPIHKDATPFFFPVLSKACNKVTSILVPGTKSFL